MRDACVWFAQSISMFCHVSISLSTLRLYSRAGNNRHIKSIEWKCHEPHNRLAPAQAGTHKMKSIIKASTRIWEFAGREMNFELASNNWHKFYRRYVVRVPISSEMVSVHTACARLCLFTHTAHRVCVLPCRTNCLSFTSELPISIDMTHFIVLPRWLNWQPTKSIRRLSIVPLVVGFYGSSSRVSLAFGWSQNRTCHCSLLHKSIFIFSIAISSCVVIKSPQSAVVRRLLFWFHCVASQRFFVSFAVTVVYEQMKTLIPAVRQHNSINFAYGDRALVHIFRFTSV